MVHQRVVEAALSGGLPIARLHADGLNPLKGQAQHEAAKLGPPVACRVSDRFIGYRVADCPALMELTALKQRLGLRVEPFVWTRQARLDALEKAGGAPVESRADWLLVDLAQTTFSTSAGLEAIIERALERPSWRAEIAGAIARRAQRRFTSDVLADRVIRLVRDTLDDRART